MTDTLNADDRLVRWEDPPPIHGRRSDDLPWQAFSRILKRRPGSWAIIATFEATSSAWTVARAVKEGRHEPFSPEQFEVRASKNTDAHGSVLFARYIGGPS